MNSDNRKSSFTQRVSLIMMLFLFIISRATCATDLAAGQKRADTLKDFSLGQYENYHNGVAKTAAFASSLVYEDEQRIKTELTQAGFELVKYFDDLGGNQFFLARKIIDSKKKYVIAIRGTENNSTDVKRDLNVVGLCLTNVFGKVHSGFGSLAQTVYNNKEVKEALEEIKNNNADLLITGHSLGGAAANILSVILQENGIPLENMQTYTFGAPSVGNKEFFDHYESKGRIFRIRAKEDPVPYLAYFADYKHIGEVHTFANKFGEYQEYISPEKSAKQYISDSDIQKDIVTGFLEIERGGQLTIIAISNAGKGIYRLTTSTASILVTIKDMGSLIFPDEENTLKSLVDDINKLELGAEKINAAFNAAIEASKAYAEGTAKEVVALVKNDYKKIQSSYKVINIFAYHIKAMGFFDQSHAHSMNDTYIDIINKFHLTTDSKNMITNNTLVEGAIKYCTFNDINGTEWYAKYMFEMCKKGIIDGYEDLNFRGAKTVNRVEFIKMVVASLERSQDIGLPKTGSVPNTADSSQWYYKFLQKAYGKTNQYYGKEPIAFWKDSETSSSFWGESVTREEAAHILMNARGLSPQPQCSRPGGDPIKFDDVDKQINGRNISQWVYAMCEKGVMSGYPESNHFKPENELNRAEATKIIYKTFFACKGTETAKYVCKEKEEEKETNNATTDVACSEEQVTYSDKQRFYMKLAKTFFSVTRSRIESDANRANEMTAIWYPLIKESIDESLGILEIGTESLNKEFVDAVFDTLTEIIKDVLEIPFLNISDKERELLKTIIDVLPILKKTAKLAMTKELSKEGMIQLVASHLTGRIQTIISDSGYSEEIKRYVNAGISIFKILITAYTKGNIGAVKEALSSSTDTYFTLKAEIVALEKNKALYNTLIIPSEYLRVYYLFANEQLSGMADYYQLKNSSQGEVISAVAESLGAKKLKFLGLFGDYDINIVEREINHLIKYFNERYTRYDTINQDPAKPKQAGLFFIEPRPKQ